MAQVTAIVVLVGLLALTLGIQASTDPEQCDEVSGTACVSAYDSTCWQLMNTPSASKQARCNCLENSLSCINTANCSCDTNVLSSGLMDNMTTYCIEAGCEGCNSLFVDCTPIGPGLVYLASYLELPEPTRFDCANWVWAVSDILSINASQVQDCEYLGLLLPIRSVEGFVEGSKDAAVANDYKLVRGDDNNQGEEEEEEEEGEENKRDSTIEPRHPHQVYKISFKLYSEDGPASAETLAYTLIDVNMNDNAQFLERGFDPTIIYIEEVPSAAPHTMATLYSLLFAMALLVATI